ncbi:MAG: cellulose synthase complex periplasmic endoglucanase BcsZ, partial [Janthinobacterium lividum]
ASEPASEPASKPASEPVPAPVSRLRRVARALMAPLLVAGALGGPWLGNAAQAQAAGAQGANETAATPAAGAADGDGGRATTGTMQGSRMPRAPRPGAGAVAPVVPAGACAWPRLDAFIRAHVQADGRVVDTGPPAQTTSEGQSYGMFFALVNNDRSTFDRILGWTQANLAGGDLRTHLPAWRWGARRDGQYGVLDPNAASDSDLWIAYDLAEAGRLWREPRYTAIARAMLALIGSREVFDLPDFGAMLAPGPSGFALAADLWRLNPSYLPMPLLRVAAQLDPGGPWQRIAANTVRFVQATSPRGFAPDWAGYQQGKGFVVDPVNGDVGSYDAIRVYLWAGVTSPADPLSRPLLGALGGMQATLAGNGQLPEKVATLSGFGTGNAPVGFSAALLPYLRANGASPAFAALRGRVAELASHAPLGYYDSVLVLFGEGAADGRFQFTSRGQLQPAWSNLCGTGRR